jgi:ABC-type transport system involved in multi-copper enzyme maturation permease subunit
MMWLTWRQFRAQAVVAAAAMAVLAVILAITGPQLVHVYDTVVRGCQAQGDCVAAQAQLLSNDRALQTAVGIIVVGVPAIIGAFWGAPLIARELEAGTHRLVWNQSVTRTRWLAIKLSLTGLASMATAGLFSLMVTWWASPIDSVNMNLITPKMFDERGIVPIGYAAFAFALGITMGVIIRRAVPAMGTTLALFAAIQIVFPLWIRPHLVSPVTTSIALTRKAIGSSGSILGNHVLVTANVNIPGAWIYSSKIVDASGQAATRLAAPQACQRGGNPKACSAAINSLHLRQIVTYQPASHYWTFQWIETGIYLAVALLLAGFCAWWIRRRLS